jgi:hypothetical protein
MNRPEIKEIRGLCEEIDAAADSRAYALQTDRSACNMTAFDASFLEDSAGTVRKYVVETVDWGRGALGEARYYYDSSGVLRFTFHSIETARKTHKEWRVYFDRSGHELHRDERLLDGPDVAAQLELEVSQPRDAFSALCPLPEAGVDFEVVDIEARLFCDETGGFTRDAIGDSALALVNVIVDDGDEVCASHATLVVVAVGAVPHEYLGDFRVTLLAAIRPFSVQTPDTIISYTATLAGTGPDGLTYVPFLLHDTGCRPIDLSAWIEGARDATERREKLVFVCAE